MDFVSCFVRSQRQALEHHEAAMRYFLSPETRAHLVQAERSPFSTGETPLETSLSEICPEIRPEITAAASPVASWPSLHRSSSVSNGNTGRPSKIPRFFSKTDVADSDDCQSTNSVTSTPSRIPTRRITGRVQEMVGEMTKRVSLANRKRLRTSRKTGSGNSNGWTMNSTEVMHADQVQEGERVMEAYHNYVSGWSRGVGRNESLALDMLPFRGSATWSMQKTVEDIIRSRLFEAFIAAAILLDAVFIAVVTQSYVNSAIEVYDAGDAHMTGEAERPYWSIPTELAINLVFLMELALRIFALDFRFCLADGWRWNLFDLIVVTSSVVEVSGHLLDRNSPTSYIRLLRVLRMARAVRMLRLLKFSQLFTGLQLMILAFSHCSVTILWAILVLFCTVLFFSLIFVNAAASHLGVAGSPSAEDEGLRLYFSSVPMALLTLFMSMSGGLDWWDVTRPLLDIGVGYALLFVLFIIFMMIVALNIITGIFVNDAVALARMDEDLRVQTELKESRYLTDRLNDLFRDIDVNHTGRFTIRDLKAQLGREDVNMVLAMLGIDVTDAVSFFSLL
eukprot:CAMPEP_0194524796 /NCGR_PEP_ID=MMETSP0253-20130528/60091_1 /TAXON_ID=2966 /ORGANISM="Noctiluca scintillans" /LENGTH=563 /DNA_ID=CAMNT_0039369461 /DNA_START=29 /DNA_END=1716 /DNA_ORIENTATION=-